MSFQKFKSDSFCVGGKHRSSLKNIYGDLTSKGSKVLIGFCSNFNGRKSMTISDNTLEAEALSSIFENLGKISARPDKLLATNALKNPGRFLEIGTNVATSAASANPKAALSLLPEVVNFYHTGKRLYSGKFV